MKKLLVFCIIATFLLPGCVANERNDPFYGETPIVTATPETTETPIVTATPETMATPINTEVPTPTIEVIVTPDTSTGVKKYVNTDKINVRKSNSTLSDKIGILSKGDEVIAYISDGQWTYICFGDNNYGYVSTKNLSDKKPIITTFTPKPTPTPTAEPTEKPTAPPFLSPAATPADDESFDLPEDML